MAKNNKTRFFYVLYSDKTWIFDQSERALGPIYILMTNNSCLRFDRLVFFSLNLRPWKQQSFFFYLSGCPLKKSNFKPGDLR